MTEAVRLVVWDLDDTFWRGTITEGGITEYVQEHHDIVIELANRGIMSSICSKNDEQTVFRILSDHGIREYFIFPTISWAPKGQRLASLLEAVQLRPSTVMFIDDNPSNRAEATSTLPELQIEDETFIKRMLADPRFKGKDDRELTRLGQYKLLEQRLKDKLKTSGSNEEFLRQCDVRVYIDYDVMPHLDRAIELINRTNQLNFTKRRLPENIDEARRCLSEEIGNYRRQCGLVRVCDKYGDYGFVGFFMLEGGGIDIEKKNFTQELVHYCFSCRTLGMLVEQWLYEHLRRPNIKIMGEVLTDLSEVRTIDWIRLGSSDGDDNLPIIKAAPEIRVHGGCEAGSIAHYLAAYSGKITVMGNFHAGVNFVRLNSASLLLSACDRIGAEFEQEAKKLGIPYEMLISNYFDDAPMETAFVFSGQYDAPGPRRYRHRVHGWEIRIEPHGLQSIDICSASKDELTRVISSLDVRSEVKAEITSVAHHINENYESVSYPDGEVLAASMNDLFARVPENSKIIIILDDARNSRFEWRGALSAMECEICEANHLSR